MYACELLRRFPEKTKKRGLVGAARPNLCGCVALNLSRMRSVLLRQR